MMDNCCAPQWADLTRSPQVLSDNYFEVEHEVHKPLINFQSPPQLSVPHSKKSVTEVSISETNFEDSLEPVKDTCTNVAFFIPHTNKKQTDEEKDLNSTSVSLKPDKKPNKNHQVWTISTTELTSTYKKSMVDNKIKTTVPEKIKNGIHMSDLKCQVLIKSALKNSEKINVDVKKNNVQSTALTKDRSDLKSNRDSKCTESNDPVERLSGKMLSFQKRQFNTFKGKRRSLSKPYPRVLTCQYRRQSLMKYKRCSNQFISLAEAVSKFQNGTPQRFRTISNKNLKAGFLMKLKQHPLKLTHPISPPLRSKRRARAPTILNQQERENLELEEMKKHQIKANPVPVNILKAPCVLKKVAKKPPTVTEEFRLTQNRKTRHTIGSHLNSQSTTHNKENNCKNSAPITRSTSATNVAVKKDNACTGTSSKDVKHVTNTLPSSFITRNKQYEMKKEEKLKNLHVQETNKIKTEFHARPAPKFTKITNTVKEQSEKKRIVPCPFSFAERDKSLAKKKEELVKNMQGQNKEIPAFHANPAPIFKPVLVHGLSKENIQGKEKGTSNLKKLITKQTKSCVDQENKQPNVITTTTSVNAKKKDVKQYVHESDKKQAINTIKRNSAVHVKNEKPKIIQRTKFELNTDKRAKERNEFDEKLKKKEQELKAKKEEEEKSKLLKEKMERAELRKMTEIKAKPMPVYKPLNILKSTKLPVSPRGPACANRNKLRSVS
ncbi:targeting protein for Xklp2-A [Megachile rotundata]|uniref:targeting protein for Xklp2-A n=1 Tax=Megachile rotundata TaxID=143995 RepID=UPI003FD39536